MTWKDVVYRFWGECSDEDAQELLMGATCYPFGSVKQVARQLKKKRKKTDIVGEAIAIACQEMDEAFEQYKKEYPDWDE